MMNLCDYICKEVVCAIEDGSFSDEDDENLVQIAEVPDESGKQKQIIIQLGDRLPKNLDLLRSLSGSIARGRFEMYIETDLLVLSSNQLCSNELIECFLKRPVIYKELPDIFNMFQLELFNIASSSFRPWNYQWDFSYPYMLHIHTVNISLMGGYIPFNRCIINRFRRAWSFWTDISINGQVSLLVKHKYFFLPHF